MRKFLRSAMLYLPYASFAEVVENGRGDRGS